MIVHKAFNCAGEKKLRALCIGDNGKDGDRLAESMGKVGCMAGKSSGTMARGRVWQPWSEQSLALSVACSEASLTSADTARVILLTASFIRLASVAW